MSHDFSFLFMVNAYHIHKINVVNIMLNTCETNNNSSNLMVCVCVYVRVCACECVEGEGICAHVKFSYMHAKIFFDSITMKPYIKAQYYMQRGARYSSPLAITNLQE